MSALQPALARSDTGQRVYTGTSPAILARIYEDSANLCIWERECDPAINRYTGLAGAKGALRPGPSGCWSPWISPEYPQER